MGRCDVLPSRLRALADPYLHQHTVPHTHGHPTTRGHVRASHVIGRHSAAPHPPFACAGACAPRHVHSKRDCSRRQFSSPVALLDVLLLVAGGPWCPQVAASSACGTSRDTRPRRRKRHPAEWRSCPCRLAPSRRKTSTCNCRALKKSRAGIERVRRGLQARCLSAWAWSCVCVCAVHAKCVRS